MSFSTLKWPLMTERRRDCDSMLVSCSCDDVSTESEKMDDHQVMMIQLMMMKRIIVGGRAAYSTAIRAITLR